VVDRRLICSLLGVLLLAGCDDATGNVSGGQASPLVATSDGGGPPTWSALYADFFGPSGVASCTAQTSCHGAASQVGAQISGFVCGTSKDECWSGAVNGIPADAGGIFPPIVPIDSGIAPTQMQLYLGLHQPSSSTDNPICAKNILYDCNMPCGDPPNCHTNVATYTFTADDLSRISTWIAQGAQNN
jgi:hypothetical protein